MKKSKTIKGKRDWLKLMALLFFFLTFIVSASAQQFSNVKLTAPAKVTNNVAFSPGTIIGGAVSFNDPQGNPCTNVTYEWQSASDAGFTQNVKKNLATTKDYDPGIVSATTYFRRVATVQCADADSKSTISYGTVKITIQR